MKTYGQFCPVAKAAELFCERWTPLIVRDLSVRPCRFSQLQRGVPLMSPTMLSKRLKQLEAEGIVEKVPAVTGRGHIYRLTEAGAEFVPLVQGLAVWGRRWARRALEQHEVDLGLLLWSIERSADPGALGSGRSVVQLELTDQPAHKRHWWYLNEAGSCVMCVDDPGHDIDLYLTTTLPEMIHIVLGDIRLEAALDDGRLEAIGAAKARAGLRQWLSLGPLAEVPAVRPELAAI
ncbi:MAG: helix-turn-helix transcriptional regulator [Rhodobiaceae bacterium]|nr:helix-turn-helix transcriptional regulator [Rhodobiaceae bacterium]